jgi:carboxypeptidase family protein
MFNARVILWWALVACLLLPAAAISQTFRGGISGTVADKSGAMVPDATVEIEQKGTGLKLSMQTTNAGIFSFTDLPVGFYTVTISHSGFQSKKITELEAQVGRISNLTITMDVAQQAQTVEVQAAAATIETTQSALNAVVSTRAIQEMPLNGRDFRQLLQLTPGFNSQFSMNGNRPNQNNWQIDGVDNNDFWHNAEAVNQGSISGIAGVLLPIDSIEEFNQQSVGGADFGRNPGSMVNVAIKSGTNAFFGTLYYFNRNDAFAKPSPFGDYGKLRNHNFGGSIGGPIWKDRAFFFFNFEAQRFIAGNSIRATVPSDAWVAQAEARMAANGVSPNPVMVTLLGTLWPSAIKSAPATTNNFFSAANNNYRSNNGVARVDYAFSSKERLFVRGFVGSGDAVAYAGSVYPDYFQAVPSRQQNWAAILNSTFGGRLVNQFLFGVNYFLQNFNDASHNQDVVALGFNTGATSADLGSPNIELDGFTHGGVGETPNLGRTDTTYHFTDDLGFTRGAHALKFGGEFRRAKLWVHYFRDARGNFLFDGAAYTGFPPPPAPPSTTCKNWGGSAQENSLADFLAGCIDNSNANIATGDPVRNWYVNSVSWYAQDNWQATPRLNFNYGLRWDYNGPIYDPTHTVSTFLPSAPGGLAIPPQTISTLYPRDLNNLAPRLERSPFSASSRE